MNERGVTPVVATILLTALVVAFTGSIAALAGKLIPGPQAPRTEFGDMKMGVGDGGNLTWLSFVHKAGQDVNIKELKVIANGIDNGGQERSIVMGRTLDSGYLKLSDVAIFQTTPGGPYYPINNLVSINIVHEPSGKILARANVTVRPA